MLESARRAAATLVTAGNVERYTRLGVRVVMTSVVRGLIERAAAGARG